MGQEAPKRRPNDDFPLRAGVVGSKVKQLMFKKELEGHLKAAFLASGRRPKDPLLQIIEARNRDENTPIGTLEVKGGIPGECFHAVGVDS